MRVSPTTTLDVAASGTTTVFVPATQAWTDSGIVLSQGQTVRISTTRQAQYSAASPAVNPKGIAFSNPKCTDDQYAGLSAVPFAGPGQSCFSLIGRLGNTPIIFEVGSNFSWKAPQAGELYLGFNDSVYSDNSGGSQPVIRLPNPIRRIPITVDRWGGRKQSDLPARQHRKTY
jgi:hypothetical protein